MHSYTSQTSSDPLLTILLGNTSVRAYDDVAAGAAGLRLDEPDAVSSVTRIRPNVALAKEALMAEYRADAAASRWVRPRLLYIGNADGDSLLRVLPTCIIAKIADAMDPRPLAAAPSSRYGWSRSYP